VDRIHNYRMSNWAMGLLGMGLAFLASGCGPSKDENMGWKPVAQNGPNSGKVTEIPMGAFLTSWKANLPLAIGTHVVKMTLDDDRIYVYTSGGKVYWIQRDGGIVTDYTVISETGLAYDSFTTDQHVVFPTEKSLKVYTTEGKFDYEINLNHSISAQVSADNYRAYISISHPKEGRVIAVDLQREKKDLEPLWELMTNEVTAKVAYYNQGVFIGTRDGKVYAVSGEKRELLWPNLAGFYYDAGSPVVADMAVDLDGVYVSTQDSKLTCLDPSSGRAKWRYYAGTTLVKDSVPQPVGSWVYLKVPGQGLAAIEKKDENEIRKPKWILTGGEKVMATDETCVYVAMEDHSITGVERATGDVKFKSERRDFAVFASNVGSMTVSDKLASDIYAATSGGEVYCIAPVSQPGKVGEWVMGEAVVKPVLASGK
jgi:outer membrane protein assembly factor BamB